jgi:hypothetical protein
MNWNEIESRLPNSTESLPAAPALTGSDKQIEWAKKIRVEIVKDLRSTIIGNATDMMAATHSKEDMIKYLEGINEFWGNNDISEEKVQSSLEKMIQMAERWGRLVQMVRITDSKYWIDNRTSDGTNYMNKNLKSYVMGK